MNLSKISQEEMVGFLKTNEYFTRIPSRMQCFGCFNENNELVGVVGLYKTAWHTTEIRGLCVSKFVRGNGIGKFIVKEAIKLVQTPLIAATVAEQNTASLKVFSSNGFTVVTSFMHMETGHNVLLLIRNNPVVEVVNGIYNY